jgi:hypothetical protein
LDGTEGIAGGRRGGASGEKEGECDEEDFSHGEVRRFSGERG